MQKSRLAAVYAKSLIDLAQELNQMETVYDDMLYLKEIFKVSREFKNVMESPIIASDKKEKIVSAVTEGKISDLTSRFIRLLIKKGREDKLEQILEAYKEQYNQVKGIYEVALTTATEISETAKQKFIDKLTQETNFAHVQLFTKVDPDIVGGFVLEYEDKLVDASIRRDLKDIKKQFKTNLYEHNIR